MLPDYEDIKALTQQPPHWYDDHGVPRYAPFDPSMLGVYDHIAVLAKIGCQGCDQQFHVGVGQPRYTIWQPTPEPNTLAKLAGRFHYGDPPRHGGCVGETMNCLDFRILEAWEQDVDWVRQPAFEVELEDAR